MFLTSHRRRKSNMLFPTPSALAEPTAPLSSNAGPNNHRDQLPPSLFVVVFASPGSLRRSEPNVKMPEIQGAQSRESNFLHRPHHSAAAENPLSLALLPDAASALPFPPVE